MSRWRAVVLVSLLVLVGVRAGGAAEQAREAEVKPYPALVLTEESKGATITVVAGRRIEIRLAANITTGYSWVIGELTPGPIKPLGDPQYVPHKRAEGMVGVGGTAVFALVGTEPGKANLRLDYKRPWEKDQPAERTFAVAFDVKPDPTPERAKQLKANLAGFSLELQYYGDQDKPFYAVLLQAAELEKEYPPFTEAARVTEEEASRIVDHLATEGYLALALGTAAAGLPAPLGPCYTLTVRARPAGGQGPPPEFREDLGWGPVMLGRLDGLRKVLDGQAAKAMDALLGRLSGYRKAWSGPSAPKAGAAPAPPGR